MTSNHRWSITFCMDSGRTIRGEICTTGCANPEAVAEKYLKKEKGYFDFGWDDPREGWQSVFVNMEKVETFSIRKID